MMRFNERAHCYEAHACVQREMIRWLEPWLDDLADPNARAIEFGAGDGQFTAHAVKRFRTLVAVDQAPRMLEVGAVRVPNAFWRRDDAWTVMGRPSQANTILSSSLLQWCPDPAATFRRWRDILLPGGRLLHGFYIDPTLPELTEVLDESVLPLRWRGLEEWRTALETAGFTVERMESESRRFAYDNALALLRSLHGVGAVAGGRLGPGRLRGAARDYDRRFARDGGGVEATWTFCRFIARRDG